VERVRGERQTVCCEKRVEEEEEKMAQEKRAVAH